MSVYSNQANRVCFNNYRTLLEMNGDPDLNLFVFFPFVSNMH